jgi:hypothetical protein
MVEIPRQQFLHNIQIVTLFLVETQITQLCKPTAISRVPAGFQGAAPTFGLGTK